MINVNSILVIFLLILTIFSFQINILFFYIKINELIIILLSPLVALYISKNYNNIKNIIPIVYFNFFLFLFIISIYFFFISILHNKAINFDHLHNIKQKLIMYLYLITFFLFLLKSKIKTSYILNILNILILMAGYIGLLTYDNLDLRHQIYNIYNQGIYNLDKFYRFDGYDRSMSIFTGFDIASITYFTGVFCNFYLLIGIKNLYQKIYHIISIFLLLLFISISGRIGFIALGILIFIYLFYNFKTQIILKLLLITILIYYFFKKLNFITYTESNIDRHSLEDIFFDFKLSMHEHLIDINYPKNIFFFFGNGYSDEFISDFGFVNIFCNGGILISIFYIYFVIKMYLYSKKIKYFKLENSETRKILLYFCFFFTMFILNLKGNEYYSNNVTGYLTVIILSLFSRDIFQILLKKNYK